MIFLFFSWLILSGGGHRITTQPVHGNPRSVSIAEVVIDRSGPR